ncbi:MAG TPA: hypothetical protein GXZ24_10175 [Firmicutes bacterium]|nr:hypothetical protein [Bacillota bacterium]
MGKHIALLLLFILFISPVGAPATYALTDNQPLLIVDNQPLLIIEQINMEQTAFAGETFYITLVVKNHGTHPAFNIIADIKSLQERDEFFTRGKPLPTNEKPDIQVIEGGETRSLTFPIDVSEKALKKDEGYNLMITLRGQKIPGGSSAEGSFIDTSFTSANTRVQIDYETTSPNITITNVALDPLIPKGQQPFTAIFYLENHSKMEARNVNITIDSKDFEVMDFTNQKFLQSISRGGGQHVAFKLRSIEKRQSNKAELTFKYDFSGKTREESKLSVNLPLDPVAPGTAPLLKISSFSLEETSNQNEYKLNLGLENIGVQKATDIALTFNGNEKIYLIQGSNVDYLPSLEGKKNMHFSYLIGINHSNQEGHLPLTVEIKYQDPGGNEISSSETLGIAASQIGIDTAAGVPRVLISKYTLSEGKILAGNTVTLGLLIENTHARPVRNIKVSLGILMVEETGSSTATSGGTVFSPINSSNSFFIQEIPAKTIFEQSIDLLVDPNAMAKTYVVPVTIEYEDGNANPYEVKEMVNIPVTQESRLQVLDIEVPPTAFMGQPAFVGAEFVNVGKVDLGNFIVMMEGPFRKEQASYFVGNLGIGMSDYYQGIIYPEEEGLLEGELIFSYIDNNNQEVQLREPFQLNVMPMMEEGFHEGEMHPGMPGAEDYVGNRGRLWLIAILVVAAAASAFFLRRRALRKRHKEFMDA